MVCDRCKMAVKSELEKLGYTVTKVELGVVKLEQNPPAEEVTAIDNILKSLGFSLIDDKKCQMGGL